MIPVHCIFSSSLSYFHYLRPRDHRGEKTNKARVPIGVLDSSPSHPKKHYIPRFKGAINLAFCNTDSPSNKEQFLVQLGLVRYTRIWLDKQYTYLYSTNMSFGLVVGNFIAISALAIKVHAAYEDAGDCYKHILAELTTLRILIDKAQQHFKSTASTTITSDDHDNYHGQKLLGDCQGVLEDLDSFIGKCKRLAPSDQRPVFARLKLDNEDIESLQGRLISNVVLLKGFVRRFV